MEFMIDDESSGDADSGDLSDDEMRMMMEQEQDAYYYEEDDEEHYNASDDDDESMEMGAGFGSFHDWLDEVIDNGDDPLPEVSRDQWLEWLETARENVGRGEYRNNYYQIDACGFICLATEPGTRQTFSAAVTAESESGRIITVELQGLEQTLVSLALCGIVISLEELNVGTSALAAIFGSFRRIDFLGLHSCDHFTLPFVLPILSACKHLVILGLAFVGNISADAFLAHLPALAACLADHPSEENVCFRSLNSQLLQMLGTVLPTIPKLHNCQLVNRAWGLGGIGVLSMADAEALARILAIPQLCDLNLSNGFPFSSDLQVTQSICDGLRNSRLSTLVFGHVPIPQSMYNVVASAITEMRELKSFTFCERVDPAFWSALGKGWEGSHTIQRLKFGSINDDDIIYLGSHDVAAFFEKANHHGLRYLKLYLNDWGPRFDAMFSMFVSNNSSLETVEIKLSPDAFVGPPIASAALLAAVDSPECWLEEITFRPSRHAGVTWLRQLNFILGLNKQRRRHNSAFNKVRKGKIDLMDATVDIGDDFLYEFLRRNEWNLQSLLRDYKA
jgi:hypothetical protein